MVDTSQGADRQGAAGDPARPEGARHPDRAADHPARRLLLCGDAGGHQCRVDGPQPRLRGAGATSSCSASRARRPSARVSFTRFAGRCCTRPIDRQRAIAAIQIGPTFSRDIEAGQPTDVQIILDGRRSNAVADRRAATSTRSSPGLAAEHAVRRAHRGRHRQRRAAQLVQPEPDLPMVHGAQPHRQHRPADRAHRHGPVDRARARARHLRPADGLAAADARDPDRQADPADDDRAVPYHPLHPGGGRSSSACRCGARSILLYGSAIFFWPPSSASACSSRPSR